MSVIDTLKSVLRFRRLELSPTRRRLRGAASVGDLRRIAKRRLPGGVFDYIDGGAEDEISLARNAEAYRSLEFQPRVLRDVSDVATATQLLGRDVSLPLILAPTGFTRIAHSQGELAVARAAYRAGIPYTLSSLSTRSIEEVRAVSNGELWFQVYVWADRDLVASMLERAHRAGYGVIVITVDTAVLGRRERDIRRGFQLPPEIGPGTIVEGLMHPGWTWDFLRHEPIRFANVAGSRGRDGSDPVTLSDYISEQFDPALDWRDLDWFRERWPKRIVLKGVQTVEDAVIASDHGIDAIALSNHGGRQLDGAPVPLELVAPVVKAVGERLEVYCDGGIRRGSDIVKALALGAHGCMVGRPYLYGLGAAGEPGVDHVLSLLHDGVRRTLALTGCRSISEIRPELVRARPGHLSRFSAVSVDDHQQSPVVP